MLLPLHVLNHDATTMLFIYLCNVLVKGKAEILALSTMHNDTAVYEVSVT